MIRLPLQLETAPESATIQAEGRGTYELDITGNTIQPPDDPVPGVYRLTVKTECGCYEALVSVPCPSPAIHQDGNDHERPAITECCP